MNQSMNMSSTMKRTIFAVAAAVFAVSGLSHVASAQDLIHKAPPQALPIVIEHATIHTVANGVIENGSIVFDKGVITQVLPAGRKPAVRGKAIHIDATGEHVYPGFVSAVTSLGLVEVSAVRATIDTSEVGAITPEVRAATAINPDSTLIPVARSGGVLTAGVFPSGGLVPGRASVIRLDGWTWEDMTVRADAGLVVNWPNMRTISAPWMDKSEDEQRKETRKRIEKIKEMFNAARAYVAARDADPTIPTDLRFEAMRPVLTGDKPVFIRAQEYKQIVSSISWAVRQGLKPVLVGGRDALLAADLLRDRDVPIILSGTLHLPGRRDAAYSDPLSLPARLEEAHLRWCLSTGGGSFNAANERNLPNHAAAAVAFGLDRAAALRSITLSAAQILGVGGTLGSIETGKAATLVIADGAPLELTTHAVRAFIDGRQIDLRNKQTELRDKYLDKYRQLGLIGDN